MNEARRTILVLGLLSMAAILAFPPWLVYEDNHPAVGFPGGHHLIFSGPSLPPTIYLVRSKDGRFVPQDPIWVHTKNGKVVPQVAPSPERWVEAHSHPEEPVYSARIDLIRLLLEWAVVATITGACMLLVPGARRTAMLAAFCLVLLGCNRAPNESDVRVAVSRAVLRMGHPKWRIYDHVVDSIRVLQVGPYMESGRYWSARVHVHDSFTIPADSVRGALAGVQSSYFADFHMKKGLGGEWNATFGGHVVDDSPPNMYR